MTASTGVSIADRGLAYGQGLFETLRADNGHVALAHWHRARMVSDARRLGFADVSALFDDGLARGLAQAGDSAAVIKLVLTAGEGGRGYASPRPLTPRLLVSVMPWRPRAERQRQHGMVLGLCKQRLADAGSLAGIKHLGRLEQVCAADEVLAHGWDEGLLLDARQRPLELTSMNLFARFGERLWTPALDRAGVAGVLRAWLLAQWLPGQSLTLCQRPRRLDELRHADEVFACNAVAGVLPVRKLALWHWPVGDLTRRLQSTVDNRFLGQ